MGAGVAEVVLLPPPAGHLPDHAGGGQRGGVAAGQDVDLAALVAAGDLPQVQGLAFVLAAGDGQSDAGAGEVVAALAAVVAGVCHDSELVVIDVGDGRAGLFLAVGEQVEPGGDDVREQVRGPATAVEAQQRSRAVPADAAQVREQVPDLGGEGVRRLGHHDQQRVAAAVGDPGFLGRRAGVPEPGDVHLLPSRVPK